jgi:hypothetical protein
MNFMEKDLKKKNFIEKSFQRKYVLWNGRNTRVKGFLKILVGISEKWECYVMIKWVALDRARLYTWCLSSSGVVHLKP